MKKRVLSILLALAMICVLVPTTVFAAGDMHPELEAILNDEGKLELDYVNPLESNDEFTMFMCVEQELWDLRANEGSEKFGDKGYSYRIADFSDDYSTFDIELWEIAWGGTSDNGWYGEESCVGTYTVDIVWAEVDPDVEAFIEEKMANFPDEKEYFEVSNLELINYGYFLDPADPNDSIAAYSSELKEFFDNKFTFSVRIGAGDGRMYYFSELGDLKIMYDGVVYYTIPYVGASAKCVIYVPTSTGDSYAELAAAIKNKVDGYFGEGTVTVYYDDGEYEYTLRDQYNDDISFYDQWYAEATQELETAEARLQELEDNGKGNTEEAAQLRLDIMTMTAPDSILQEKQAYIDSYEDGGEYDFLADAAGANGEGAIFVLEYEDTGLMMPMVVVKDDAKAAVEMPTCETVDVKTNIQIKTDDISVPLDTVVVAEKLTEGEDLNKVVKALDKVEEIANVETSVTYDINLYSEALNDNITKLDNGTFKVSLPIPEELEGKDLMVYYVDDDGNVTPHDVDFDDGKKYVTFETNHFSTYTLVEVKKADSGAQGEAIPQPEEKPVEDKEVIANTADATQVMPWMVTMMFATVGCGVVVSKRKEIE